MRTSVLVITFIKGTLKNKEASQCHKQIIIKKPEAEMHILLYQLFLITNSDYYLPIL